MNEETQKKIFDPFFSTKFTGRGLGLAAVHGFVRSNGGHVQVDSSPGNGTRIRILLPAAPWVDAKSRGVAS
jgi:signal transduction histidine kinase